MYTYIKCWVIAQSAQHTSHCANTKYHSETVGVDWCDPWCCTNIHSVHLETQGKDLWGQCAEKHRMGPVFIFLPLWQCCLTFWKAELIFQICKISMADGSSESLSFGCWMHEGGELGHTDDVSEPGSHYHHRVDWGRGKHYGLLALCKVDWICTYPQPSLSYLKSIPLTWLIELVYRNHSSLNSLTTSNGAFPKSFGFVLCIHLWKSS